MKTGSLIFALVFSLAPLAASADIMVPMHVVNENGIGASVGQVTISESKYGLVFTPALNNLTPGSHGFHVHQNADCQPKEKDGKMVAALGAGGHYDPAKTNHHGTPWGDGHLGDLPASGLKLFGLFKVRLGRFQLGGILVELLLFVRVEVAAADGSSAGA